MSSPQIQNAAEAIRTLTDVAAALATRLGQLSAALQQSSSANVASASEHLALYQEVVQTLQVVTIVWLCNRMYVFLCIQKQLDCVTISISACPMLS